MSTEPIPAPTPNGRNRRRRALIAARMDRAYEAGRRDGRAEATGQAPAPDTVDEILDRVAQALYQHAVTAGGRYPAQERLMEEHTRQTFLASAAHRAAAVMTAIAPALAARDARIAELELLLHGTLDRRCSIPGCAVSHNAGTGPPPEEATAARHWLRKSAPSLLLCPDHSHLWEGDTPHTPRLDHTTRTCACSCGHPLPGPTLGHMGTAWVAHALNLLEADRG